jgi:hypothetical protein
MIARITWLRPVVPAGAILILFLVALGGAGRAHAQDNTVRIEPPGSAVAPDGTFKIGIVDDPPAESLAAWVIELKYDPDVVAIVERGCVTMSTPGGAFGAFDCQVTDDDGDGKKETAKILGAVLFSRSQKGLVNETKLVDITFRAVGTAGSCSDLRLRIRIHADSEGEETGARVQDGRGCILGSAPVTGTASAFPATPRTSEPTPTGGGDGDVVPTIAPNGGQGGEPGQETEPGSSPGTDGSPAGTGGLTTVPGQQRTQGPQDGGAGGVENSDDDTRTFVWVVVAASALVIAAAGAWGIVRMRGRGPGGGQEPRG